jgi:hypothetical protein
MFRVGVFLAITMGGLLIDIHNSYSATLFVVELVILLANVINTFRRSQAKQAGISLNVDTYLELVGCSWTQREVKDDFK